MKRLFIIHGWGGYPEEGWFPWLKKAAEKLVWKVDILKMPNPNNPKIAGWVSFLKSNVKELNEETFFVGHSIGCQTILRYVEKEQKKCGGIILVAGWIHLKLLETKEEEKIAKPWLETPIEYNKIISKTDNIVAIFSTSDPFVPLSDAKIFEKNLKAKIIIEKEKGHFSGSDDIKEMPSVLKELTTMSK